MAAGDLLQIPTYSDPAYSQTITIDGIDYVLSFRWNMRCALWFLDLADASGNPLVSSIACVPLYPLLVKFQYLDVPQGVLVILPRGPDDPPPQVSDFGPGLRMELDYFETS